MEEIRVFKLQPPETVEELLSTVNISPSGEKMDPREKEATAYIRQNRNLIVELVKGQNDYWTRVLESLKTNVGNNGIKSLDTEIEHNDFLIVCRTMICDGKIAACRTKVVGKEWGEKRLKYIKETFSQENLSEKDKKFDLFPIELLAKRLNVQEKRSFTITQTFNPDEIDKRYRKPIDGRMRELVRLLNEMGIKTVEACIGHRTGMYKRPYIMFEENQLTHIIALLLAWEKSGEVKWRIQPRRDTFVQYAQIVPAPDTSLSAAHTDIDRLTDFLIAETGQTSTERLTPAEIAHRIRRAIFNALGL